MRFIRTIPTGGASAPKNNIDAVTDPQLLAHAILNLGVERTEVQYPAYLRVSMLHDVCVKERVLGYRSNAMFKKVVNTSLQFTFDLGHAIHDFLQNSDKYFGDTRVGWWKCSACGHKYFGKFPQMSCQSCSAPKRAIRYSEHSIRMEDPFRTTGHIDSFIEVTPGSFRLCDFKTINGDDFEKLKAPKGDHLIQVSAYQMLMEHDKTLPIKIHPTKGFVIYLSKKHTVKSLPIKVFHTTRNQVTDNYITNILSAFTEAINDPSVMPPPHIQCEQTNYTCYRAKNCAMLAECRQSR